MKFKIILVVTILAIVAIPSYAAYYFYTEYTRITEDPTAAAKQETEKLLTSLSALMLLPEGEPSLLTVLDKDSLSKEPFFKNSENGDKVLVFSDSHKAILYRPSTNKIIDVMQIQEQQTVQSNSSNQQPELQNNAEIDNQKLIVEPKVNNSTSTLEILDEDNSASTTE